ncbi:MAG: DUF721 domain-containing protein [Proteobacteria bacterium]|nr:DUF721 domain-containing protein [Pseudomonadota bacterium]
MKSPPDLSRRKSRPQSFGAALTGMLRAIGGRASDSDLSEKWAEIVGTEIASAAKLVGLSKGVGARRDAPNNKIVIPGEREARGKGTPLRNVGRTLTVRATNPAGALALSYRAEEIRTRVNKYFGYDAVGSVKVKK